jgi:Xrn1 helical domain
MTSARDTNDPLGDFRGTLGPAQRFPGCSRSCSEISGLLSEQLGDFRVTLGAARRFPGYSRSCSGILGAAREFSELLGNSWSCSDISGLFSELLGTVEQLMAVLPEDSSHAIPKKSQWLMSDEESPCSHSRLLPERCAGGSKREGNVMVVGHAFSVY